MAELRSADPLGHALLGDFGSMGQAKADVDALTEALQRAREASTNARMALTQQSVIEAHDPMAAARGEFDREIGKLNQRFRRSQDDPIGAQDEGIFISEAQYRAEYDRLTSLREVAEKAAHDAKKKPPKDNSAQEAKRLADFGDRAAESIARINERFDEQPKLIDQAAQATRQLDAVIKDLNERKPAGFKDMIDDAERAKTVIQDALVRPFRDLAAEAARRVEIERLLTAGRDKEATVLQAIWQMEQRIGPLNDEQADAVRDIVEAREDELKVLRRLQDEQNAYLDATRSVRSEIEAIFAGRGSVSNFQQIFRDLNARVLTQQLFGNVLDQLDDSVKAQFGRAVDALESDTQRAGEAALTFADTLNEASRRVASGETGATPQSFADAFGSDFVASLTGTGANAPANDNDGTILVTAQRLERGVAGMTPDGYAHLMARAVVKPLIDELGDVLGPRLAEQIGGVMQGALYGFATAGSTGGILGGLQGLNQQFGDGLLGRNLASLFGSNLGTMLQGAQSGSMISGLAGAFGIGLSGTGSQLGGAIGSIIPGVGSVIGAIGGGILGKIIGGLFGGSKKYGTAQLTGTTLSTYGKGDGRAQGAGTLGGAVQEGLARIADQLDAQIGSYLVSIGTYKDSYRVNTRGGTGKLGGYSGSWAEINQRYGLYDFGDDQGAAIAFAVLDALKDGAIKGISAGAQRLLQQGGDIEKAVQDALDFQSVFSRLKALKDPVGAEMDDLDREFERLKTLFTKAGASTQEWSQLEELYWLERDQIIKEATERELGTLKGFLSELTSGNSALSLRDRKAAAVADYTPLANRVAAGDTTAYDDFVEAARALLDIERQLSGSQQGYFDLLNQVTGLTQGALDGGAGAGFAGRNTPFGMPPADNAGVIASIGDTNALLQTLVSGVDAMNKNMGTLIDLNGNPAPQYAYGGLGAGW
ncbi:MAG TPA: hypothetical protein VNR51_11835 [Hyphomicrobium sp.]|nr:hypothetical protein [Hyphomicrobium sp.]